MELIIIAVITNIDDLLIAFGYRLHTSKMLNVETMTRTIIGARYYGENHKNAYCMLKINHRLNIVSKLFETLFAPLCK